MLPGGSLYSNHHHQLQGSGAAPSLPTETVEQRVESARDGIHREEGGGDSFVCHARTPDPQRYSSHTPSTLCRGGGGRHLSLPNSCHRSLAPERFSTLHGSSSKGDGNHHPCAGPEVAEAMRQTTLFGDHAFPPPSSHAALAPLASHSGPMEGVPMGASGPLATAAGHVCLVTSPSAQPLQSREDFGYAGRATTLYRSGGPSNGCELSVDHGHLTCDHYHCENAVLSSPCVVDPRAATVPTHPPPPLGPAARERVGGPDASGDGAAEDDEILIARPTVSPPRSRTGRLSVVLSSVVAASLPPPPPHSTNAALDAGVDDSNSLALLSSSTAQQQQQLAWQLATGLLPVGPCSNEESGSCTRYDAPTQGRQWLPQCGEQDEDSRYHYYTQEDQNQDVDCGSTSSSLLSPLAKLEQAPRKSYLRDGVGESHRHGDLFDREKVGEDSDDHGCGFDGSTTTHAEEEAEEEECQKGKGPLPVSTRNEARGCPVALQDLASFDGLPNCLGGGSSTDATGDAIASPLYAMLGANLSTGSTASSSLLPSRQVATCQSMDCGGGRATFPSYAACMDASMPSTSSQLIVPIPATATAWHEGNADMDGGRMGGLHDGEAVWYCADGGPSHLSHISPCEEGTTQDSLSRARPVSGGGHQSAQHREVLHPTAAAVRGESAPVVDIADHFAHLNLQGSPTQKRLAFDDAAEDSCLQGAGARTKEEEEEEEGEGGSGPPRSGAGGHQSRQWGPHSGSAAERVGEEEDWLYTPPPRTTRSSPITFPAEPSSSPYTIRQQQQGQGHGQSASNRDPQPHHRPASAGLVAARRRAKAASTVVMGSRPTGLQLLQSRKRCLEEMCGVDNVDGSADTSLSAVWQEGSRRDLCHRAHGPPSASRVPTATGGEDCHGAPLPLPSSSPAPLQQRDSRTCQDSANTSVGIDHLASTKRCRREFQQHKQQQHHAVLQEISANAAAFAPHQQPETLHKPGTDNDMVSPRTPIKQLPRKSTW